jgi:hypothetical protein
MLGGSKKVYRLIFGASLDTINKNEALALFSIFKLFVAKSDDTVMI